MTSDLCALGVILAFELILMFCLLNSVGKSRNQLARGAVRLAVRARTSAGTRKWSSRFG
jgi:hypothetical protein